MAYSLGSLDQNLDSLGSSYVDGVTVRVAAKYQIECDLGAVAELLRQPGPSVLRCDVHYDTSLERSVLRDLEEKRLAAEGRCEARRRRIEEYEKDREQELARRRQEEEDKAVEDERRRLEELEQEKLARQAEEERLEVERVRQEEEDRVRKKVEEEAEWSKFEEERWKTAAVEAAPSPGAPPPENGEEEINFEERFVTPPQEPASPPAVSGEARVVGHPTLATSGHPNLPTTGHPNLPTTGLPTLPKPGSLPTPGPAAAVAPPTKINFSDFEALSDPFADLELKTMDDLAELRAILSTNTTSPAGQAAGQPAPLYNQGYSPYYQPASQPSYPPNPQLSYPPTSQASYPPTSQASYPPSSHYPASQPYPPPHSSGQFSPYGAMNAQYSTATPPLQYSTATQSQYSTASQSRYSTATQPSYSTASQSQYNTATQPPYSAASQPQYSTATQQYSPGPQHYSSSGGPAPHYSSPATSTPYLAPSGTFQPQYMPGQPYTPYSSTSTAPSTAPPGTTSAPPAHPFPTATARSSSEQKKTEPLKAGEEAGGGLKPSRSVGNMISELQKESSALAQQRGSRPNSRPQSRGATGLENWVPWPQLEGEVVGQSSSPSTRRTSEEDSCLADLMDDEANSCRQLHEMGFPISRLAKGCQAVGANHQKLINFCLVVDRLVEEGFPELEASHVAMLHNGDEDVCRTHLRSFSHLAEIGFPSKDVHEALIQHSFDHQKALDQLIT